MESLFGTENATFARNLAKYPVKSTLKSVLSSLPSVATPAYQGRMVYKSPARILRDVKRITKFCDSKKKSFPREKPVLSITILTNTSIPPDSIKAPTLSIKKTTLISIPAVKRVLSIQKTFEINIPSKPKTLSFSQPTLCSIFPITLQPYLHPFIIEASKMLYGVPPWELTEEQTEHFRGYQEYKIQNGRPIEEDLSLQANGLKIPH